ncbi:MAG: MTAP family purine nucleoside phosphorylase [Mucispirillum sp.]|nr:MTAP family purine nucleoside phosphorylase [Mucispirillum sp.]
MKKIGIIGGSGLENITFLSFYGEEFIETHYGSPSCKYKIYNNDDVMVYSLSRHGDDHRFAPHQINYKANIYGFHLAGVNEILSFSAAGGINLNYKSGDLVLTDDAIDNTVRGNITFYDRAGYVVHIDMSQPFCLSVREKLKESANLCGIKLIENGTYICTDGPRFETPAEIKMYRAWGADMVGMTLFPEVTLSKEMGICYANISLITNAAAGVEGCRKLTSDEVIEEAQRSALKISQIIEQYIKYDKREECNCKDILQGAAINKQS